MFRERKRQSERMREGYILSERKREKAFDKRVRK